MLGDASAAKTALTIRFISGFYLEELKLTIGVDFYSKTTNHNGQNVKLQIWDFGGEERFRFLLHQYCKGSNAALFLFDITNRLSLDHLPDWTQIIRENVGDIPIMLVGTKAHLNEHRTVTREDAIQAAHLHNLSGFIEVSSKTGQNVEKLFDIMTEILFERYRPYGIGDNKRLPVKEVNKQFGNNKRLPVIKVNKQIGNNKQLPALKVNTSVTHRLENRNSVISVGRKIFRQLKSFLKKLYE